MILLRNSVTHFEDLSNDLIYEIFEYIDAYHIYEGFFNLNTRFQNLLINSTVPIKINISSLSKSTFQSYYTHFIMPNKHRIKSLHLSNPFTIDFFFSSTEDILKCSRLETLILHNIEPKCLENLLLRLISSPNLSSLVVCFGYDSNKNTLYNLILQLPVLKYCKIFLNDIEFGMVFRDARKSILPLPFSTNKFSPIEHLVINDSCGFNEIIPILSYVPQLRRLSINYLSEVYNQKTEISPIVLNNLTHLSLTMGSLRFDQFEQFIKNLFNALQVLHITTKYHTAYLDADRWEQLILSHMPHLKIFDFHHTDEMLFVDKYEGIYQSLLKKFTSSFWSERQWFFVHGRNCRAYSHGIFYSIQPYR